MFSHLPFLRAGISHRKDGSMKLLGEQVLDAEPLRRRKDFFVAQEVNPDVVITAGLVHGTRIVSVDLEDRGRFIPHTDGLITNIPGLVLSITIADCAPVFVIDPAHRAIGLVHAGWRGTVDGIIVSLFESMVSEFSTNPAEVFVEIGPHLQCHHFDVQEDVAGRFKDVPGVIQREEGRMRLDLNEAFRTQLERLQIPQSRIHFSEECTFCDSERYFSYRRDRPSQVEAMVAYLEIHKE